MLPTSQSVSNFLNRDAFEEECIQMCIKNVGESYVLPAFIWAWKSKIYITYIKTAWLLVSRARPRPNKSLIVLYFFVKS